MRSLLFAHRSWDSELDAQFLQSTHTYLLRHILIVEFSYLLDHTYCRMGLVDFVFEAVVMGFFSPGFSACSLFVCRQTAIETGSIVL